MCNYTSLSSWRQLDVRSLLRIVLMQISHITTAAGCGFYYCFIYVLVAFMQITIITLTALIVSAVDWRSRCHILAFSLSQERGKERERESGSMCACACGRIRSEIS